MGLSSNASLQVKPASQQRITCSSSPRKPQQHWEAVVSLIHTLSTASQVEKNTNATEKAKRQPSRSDE